MKNIWDRVYGQEKVKHTLSNFIKSDKIPHAILFSGTSGIGKFSTAIQFALAVVENQPSLSEKDKIESSIKNLEEPYVKFIYPLPRASNETPGDRPFSKYKANILDEINAEVRKKSIDHYYELNIAKANNIKINSIRDINKFLSFSFSENSYRFIIISDAHLMSEESQNALLKNLEEPPEKVIFILITDKIASLRETIISRCWCIYFSPLNKEHILAYLSQYHQIEEQEAKNIAIFSKGSVTVAKMLIENNLEDLLAKTINVLRYSLGRKYHTAITNLNEIVDLYNSVDLIIFLLITWFKDTLIVKNNYGDIQFTNYKDTIVKFNSRYPDLNTESIISNLEYLRVYSEKNLNLKVITLNIIFELASISLR